MIHFRKKVYFNPLPAPIGAYVYGVEGNKQENTLAAFGIGDTVRVSTKHYGQQVGEIIEVIANAEWPQLNQYLVKPHEHPRNIIAALVDIKAGGAK